MGFKKILCFIYIFFFIFLTGCLNDKTNLDAGDAKKIKKETFRLKMATSWSGGGVVTQIGPKAFSKKISLLTNGKIKVQTFPAGTLGKAFKVSGTVKNGVADMGHSWMGYDWGRDKATVLFAGYAGIMDDRKMIHWLYEGGGLELWQEYRLNEWGLISFPCYIFPPEVFLHSRKPVRTIKDFEGLKLRTSGAWLEIVNQMGASAVTMPSSEVYTSLERGAIDATEWGTLSINLPMGLHKIAKYIIVPGIHQPSTVGELLINKDVWDKFSEHQKKMIALAAKLVTFESWTKIGHDDVMSLKNYKSNEIIVLSKELQNKTRKIALEWAKNESDKNSWFKKVFDHQRSYEKKWKGTDIFRITNDFIE